MASLTDYRVGRVDLDMADDLASRKVIIFDYDGTLANTTGAILRTARQVLHEYGMSDEEMGDLRRLIGPPLPLGFSIVCGIPVPETQGLTKRYRALFAQIGPEGYPFFEGIPVLLRALKAQDKHLAVATSRFNSAVHSMLAEQGALDLFDVVSGRPDDDIATSDKTPLIQRDLEVLGTSPDTAVMIGDRHFDMEAAHIAGVVGVGVTYAGTSDKSELAKAGAAAIATSVDELAHILGCTLQDLEEQK